MTAKEELEQKVKELNQETQKTVEVKKEEKALAISQLDAVRSNSELAKMYNENASLGADNLSGELPLLKVHATGRSTKNELSDGSEPKDGNFFYKPTAEQFETLTCHILTISRGFYADGIDKEKPKKTFNQIIGGVIINGGEMKPFIFYATGLRLKPMWEFGKSISKFTKMKPVGIPMFAMTARLTTEKVKNDFGSSWIVNFELVKNEDGTPTLVTDMGEFQFLKNHVEMVKETIEGIIDAKTIKEAGEGEDDMDLVLPTSSTKVVRSEDYPF